MTPRKESIRKTAIKRSQHWWYCDNILNHPGQCGLLKMDFPRVFILFCDYDVSYWTEFDDWKNDIELTFFTPQERKDADIENILIDAWNFLALIEEEEENQYELHNGYTDDYYI